MTLPGWPPRDWRAIVALGAQIAGAGVLTGVACWIVWILWRGAWPVETASARIDALAKALLGILLTIAIVLISLGLAINRRTVKGTIGPASFEATGGDDTTTTPGQTVVETTTTVSAPVPARPEAAI